MELLKTIYENRKNNHLKTQRYQYLQPYSYISLISGFVVVYFRKGNTYKVIGKIDLKGMYGLNKASFIDTLHNDIANILRGAECI